MSDAPSSASPPPLSGRNNRYQEMARASWLAPIIAIVVNLMLTASRGGAIPEDNKVQMVLGPSLIVVGLLLGIIALFGIRTHGRRKILAPAIVGILVNALLISLALLPIVMRSASRVRFSPLVHIPSSQVLRDDRLGFSIDIPDGFREFPEGKNAPTIEHVFVKGVVGGGEVLTVINIERLGGLLPKNKPLRVEEMPDGFQGKIVRRNWRGATVDSITSLVDQPGARMVVYTTQIPLRLGAIQINVGGPESKQAELDELTNQLLASLDGQTNW